MAHASDDVVQVAEVFASVAQALNEDRYDMTSALGKIVRLAVESLDACEFAGISFVEKGTITSPASSNDIPRRLDEIQTETGEGPCIDGITDHEVFQTGDLRNERRWPNFSSRGHEETGVVGAYGPGGMRRHPAPLGDTNRGSRRAFRRRRSPTSAGRGRYGSVATSERPPCRITW